MASTQLCINFLAIYDLPEVNDEFERTGKKAPTRVCSSTVFKKANHIFRSSRIVCVRRGLLSKGSFCIYEAEHLISMADKQN